MKKRLSITIAVIAIGLICTTAVAKRQMGEKKLHLPSDVASALMDSYPGADIEKAEKEQSEAVVYEVELELNGGGDIEVLTADDGTILEVENDIEATDLPFDLVACLPRNAQTKEIESKVIHAELKPVVLAEPLQTYEVEAIVDGKKVEFVFDVNGTIIKQRIEDEGDDEHHGNKCCKDDDDNEDEDEQEVSFAQLPATVQTALTSAAENGKIKEIEIEDGNYEADVMINGVKYEVKIASDGTVISKKVDADEDEDDDND